MRKFESFRYTSVRLAILCTLAASLSTAAFSQATTTATQSDGAASPPMTVILVRHAEKAVVPPENKDPDLSQAGLSRAEQIRKMFGDAGIAAIYATQYKRTQQTAKPLAEKLGLPVTQVQAKNTSDLVKQIRSKNQGQIIFIAGHNNTVPEIIAALGGPKLSIIPETEYDNLYLLTVLGDGTAKLLKLKY